MAALWRDAAQSWPAGFADTRSGRNSAFLLEEMAGLGILREVRATRAFALRNPNVVTLLGTEDEILGKLQAAHTWEAAPRYEADKFRRTLAQGAPERLSPLTALQEGEIRIQSDCVAVVRGTKAAGCDDLQGALSQLFARGESDRRERVQNARRFAKLLDRENKSGSLAVFVPAATAWMTRGWRLRWSGSARFCSERVFTAVVFAECFPPLPPRWPHSAGRRAVADARACA